MKQNRAAKRVHERAIKRQRQQQKDRAINAMVTGTPNRAQRRHQRDNQPTTGETK